MRRTLVTLVTAVSLLPSSAAAHPALAGAVGAPAPTLGESLPAGEPAVANDVTIGWSPPGAAAGVAGATAETAATASWKGGPILALPGAEFVGEPIVVIGGVLALLLVVSLLLIRRSGTDSEERPSTSAGLEKPTRGSDGPAGNRPSDSGGSNAGVTPHLRTDEEHVIQLLIANHGRMKQSQIVEETDWSKAKVSRLLSRMEDYDLIVRTRAGRENIVQLADANLSISP